MTAKSVRKPPFKRDPAPANTGMLLGYARVPEGDEQNNASQAEALRAAGCRKLSERAMIRERTDLGKGNLQREQS